MNKRREQRIKALMKFGYSRKLATAISKYCADKFRRVTKTTNQWREEIWPSPMTSEERWREEQRCGGHTL